MKFKAIKVPAKVVYTKGGHRYTIPEHYRLLENEDGTTEQLAVSDVRIHDCDHPGDDADPV